jgi:predicted  nucleic acid-binding Zn-ribbon protein
MSKEEARSLMDGLLLSVPLPYVPEAQVIVDKIYEEEPVIIEEAQNQEQELENTETEEPQEINNVVNDVAVEEVVVQDDVPQIDEESEIPFSDPQIAIDELPDEIQEEFDEPPQDEIL